ncbi:uncharacterized protein CEXT_752931 [Caerostris extrusa]|uniref:Sushi domain-containing protein n=1 Tax=Caerostris extrusa TaxID=172846 RepID=A0AAV4M8F5_CAEEX|nr:uncharacterized protein CEXT_752931 [Caerostris extrusa]
MFFKLPVFIVFIKCLLSPSTEATCGRQENFRSLHSETSEIVTAFRNSITLETSTSIINKNVKQSVCEDVHSKDVCDLLSLCTGCEILSIKCTISETTGTPQCLNEIHSLKDDYFEYQEKFLKNFKYVAELASRCPNGSHHILLPQFWNYYPSVCHLAILERFKNPGVGDSHLTFFLFEPMKTSGSFVAYMWKLLAFIDCSVTLASPGTVDCYTGTTRSAPLCYISCARYEDKPEVPRRAYECTLNGKWNRDLPFCVTSGSGLFLSARPKTFFN